MSWRCREAPLAGPQRHFINEVEIHPGYYVDWDPTPDETIAPLAQAYGEYITRLLTERRAAEALYATPSSAATAFAIWTSTTARKV